MAIYAVDFVAWMQRLNLTFRSASEALGISERTAYNYAGGATIPEAIALACESLEAEFEGWMGRIPYRGFQLRPERVQGGWIVHIDAAGWRSATSPLRGGAMAEARAVINASEAGRPI